MVAYGMLKLLLVFCVVDWSSGDRRCRRLLEKEAIVPTCANGMKSTTLQVNFKGKDYKCGDTVLVTDNLFAPTVTFDVKGRCKYVTVAEFLLTDPNIAWLSPYLLWLVYNVPAADLSRGFKGKSGKEVAEYVAEKDLTAGITTNKTIVFFVYCQDHCVCNERPMLRPERIQYDLKKNAEEKQLGNPMAVSALIVLGTKPDLLDAL